MSDKPVSANKWISWDPHPNQSLVCAAATMFGLFVGAISYIALFIYILAIVALAYFIKPRNPRAQNEKRNAMVPSRREISEGLTLSIFVGGVIIIFVAFNAFVLCPLGACIDWW